MDMLRIGELSARAGVAASTVRYYERLALLSAEKPQAGGQRRYAEATVARLRKIEQLKALGLSLDEVASVIDLYFEDPSGRKPKVKVLSILRRHLTEAEAKLGAMTQFRDDLRAHIERFETWLDMQARTGDGE